MGGGVTGAENGVRARLSVVLSYFHEQKFLTLALRYVRAVFSTGRSYVVCNNIDARDRVEATGRRHEVYVNNEK